MSCRVFCPSPHRSRRRRRGFSLVEIMVVIVIIGLLAGVVTVNVRGYLIKAKQSTDKTHVEALRTTLAAFHKAYGK